MTFPSRHLDLTLRSLPSDGMGMEGERGRPQRGCQWDKHPGGEAPGTRGTAEALVPQATHSRVPGGDWGGRGAGWDPLAWVCAGWNIRTCRSQISVVRRVV